MSDYKPNDNQNNGEDMEALLQLLERLKKRDEVSRYQATVSQLEDLIIEETPDPVQPARFQPTEQTAVDARDLLLTDMEDPLQMSEYLVDDPGSEYLIGEEVDMLYGDEEELPEPPKTRRNPFKALWLGFCGNLPRKGDTTGTTIRKCGFLFSLLVMLLAIIYLVMDLVVVPVQNDQLKKELIALYHYDPQKPNVVVSKEEVMTNHYPVNMLASFTDLYDRNDDVRGWISYHAGGKKDFLDIEYPIVYQNVRDTENPYLDHDYDGGKNKNGTLFFAQNNRLNSYRDTNRALIVYGHNMASGQMFAGLNKMYGNLNNARAAATFTMSTLFRVDQYKVFAVVLIDEADRNERSYNMWRTQFANDVDFLRHIEGIQARSMFEYDVDVTADDQILVLSTCTGKSSAHVKDGRLLVVARRVRDGEDAAVNTASIKKNDDVIMPYSWYTSQGKPVHKYYAENGLISGPVTLPTVSTSPTQSKPSTSTLPGQTTTGTGTTGVTGTDATSPSSPQNSSAGSSNSTDNSTNASSANQTTAMSKPTESAKPECNHQYDNDCDTTCNVEGCGYQREVAHVYNDCEDATCNREGCGYEREAGSCAFVETGIENATCVDSGLRKYNCSVCGKPKNETIPATGEHTYGEDGLCTGCSAEKPTESTEE